MADGCCFVGSAGGGSVRRRVFSCWSFMLCKRNLVLIASDRLRLQSIGSPALLRIIWLAKKILPLLAQDLAKEENTTTHPQQLFCLVGNSSMVQHLTSHDS